MEKLFLMAASVDIGRAQVAVVVINYDNNSRCTLGKRLNRLNTCLYVNLGILVTTTHYRLLIQSK